MRQRLGWLVLVALMVPSLAALAQTEESFLDRFNAVSYSGNNGSLDWSGSWVESGESDGPSAGQVRVDGGLCSSGTCLTMSGGTLEEVGVHRKANLSEFLDARLLFQVDIAPALLSTGLLYVEVRGGGSGWTAVADYLLAGGGSHSESIDVSGYIGSDFGVRYRLVGMLGGDSVYIDDVEVIGHVLTTTTTTTTTTTSTTTSTTTPTTATEATTTTIGASGSSSTTSTSTTVSGSTSDTVTDERDPDRSGSDSEDGARGDPGEGGEAESETTEPVASAPGTRPPPGSGIRAPVVGLMADYRSGAIAGKYTDEVEVLGVEVEADFSLAVEAFEEARLWFAILSLIIAAAVVGGMDRKRSKGDPSG